MSAAVARSSLPFPIFRRGKVRDVYDLGDRLLLLASDRISAFDVVLPQPVPSKGAVLTQLSAWWFRRTEDIIPNHLISASAEEMVRLVPALETCRAGWAGRAMLTRKLEPIPVECVVRGYISGSAWAEYRASGTLAGEPLPPRLAECGRLAEPLFSPARKAEAGHDENISFAETMRLLGGEIAARLRDLSIALYLRGRDIAAGRGIIIADTKFEFGRDSDGNIFLIDEVLTPDSSRFWRVQDYQPGRPQLSLDKQPVRDYLQQLADLGEWNKQPPPPDLPPDVVADTSARYLEAVTRLAGCSLAELTGSTAGAG